MVEQQEARRVSAAPNSGKEVNGTMYLWLLAQSYLAMPRRQEGQGLVEYALIIVLVAVLIIVALLALKNQVSGTFSTIVSGLSQ